MSCRSLGTLLVLTSAAALVTAQACNPGSYSSNGQAPCVLVSLFVAVCPASKCTHGPIGSVPLGHGRIVSDGFVYRSTAIIDGLARIGIYIVQECSAWILRLWSARPLRCLSRCHRTDPVQPRAIQRWIQYYAVHCMCRRNLPGPYVPSTRLHSTSIFASDERNRIRVDDV